jgi:hypothetical protein
MPIMTMNSPCVTCMSASVRVALGRPEILFSQYSDLGNEHSAQQRGDVPEINEFT